VALCGMMLVQAAATALERGDRQMEAVEWIVANHQGTDPVLVGIVRPNRLSLEYHGLRKKGVIRGIEVSRKKLQEVTQSIREEAATGGRGYFLVYYTEAPVIQALQDLIAEKFILAERHWVLSGSTMVGAYAREAGELPWLQRLTPPVQAWGPTQGEPLE
jgi:hypothetical protein